MELQEESHLPSLDVRLTKALLRVVRGAPLLEDGEVGAKLLRNPVAHVGEVIDIVEGSGALILTTILLFLLQLLKPVLTVLLDVRNGFAEFVVAQTDRRITVGLFALELQLTIHRLGLVVAKVGALEAEEREDDLFRMVRALEPQILHHKVLATLRATFWLTHHVCHDLLNETVLILLEVAGSLDVVLLVNDLPLLRKFLHERIIKESHHKC